MRDDNAAPDATTRLLEMPTLPLDWAEIFGNDHSVELEVGSGKGWFLTQAAGRAPERNFLGIEIARKYATRAAERLVKRGLSNARIICGDARKILAELVPAATLSAVHVYFPDPWWKRRHRKRRVFCDDFIDDATRRLAKGGDLHIATDVEEYFGVMTRLMAKRPMFVPQAAVEPLQPEHEFDYLTSFERKYRIEGRTIYRAQYRLT